MRILSTIMMLAFAWFVVPAVTAQTGDSLSQYQNAVQVRMDDLVRSATREFFVQSQLEPVEVTEVVSTSKFDIDASGARITSLDLKVTMISDHPSEVVRQLRQYIGRSLNGEGFVLDQFSDADAATPMLTMVINVEKPIVFSKFGVPENWREYGVFGLIVLALLSTMFFGGYLLMLPFSSRRRKLKKLDVATEQIFSQDPEFEQPLPELPGLGADASPPAGLPSLDQMLAQEKERQHFPVWLNNSGVRMANIEAIRKAFEVLPFDEAIEMLSFMDASDRTVILNRLNFNNSVKDRIAKELATRILVPNS